MRIGVIGSGIAGLSAAYLLARRHDVTLLEKHDRLGGHANTLDVVTPDGRALAIDTGFIVHNRRTYPNLVKLFAELGVATQASEMSMSVQCDGCGLEYAGAMGLSGLFPSTGNLTNRRYLRMLAEVRRFHRQGRAIADDASYDGVTVGDLLAAGGYSDYFRDHYLLAVIGCVWSSSQDLAAAYPARYLFRFLDNHGMLAVTGSPQWRTVVGGSRQYVDRIGDALGSRVRLGTEVVGVTRDRAGARVIVEPGVEERFDRLVIATHPDQALKLLDDPSEDEQRLLGAWRYSTNDTVLHTDGSLLPAARRAGASWNYRTGDCGADAELVRVTYDLTRLMRLDDPVRYLVSLNQTDRIDPASVIARMGYDHPVYTTESLAAQRELPALDGVRNTWYCGAYHGWGFHEDGCLSGVRVARALGVDW